MGWDGMGSRMGCWAGVVRERERAGGGETSVCLLKRGARQTKWAGPAPVLDGSMGDGDAVSDYWIVVEC